MTISIAVMNAKGGVGKSTTVMMVADTLTSQFERRVLVIDGDPQASISMMLLGEARLDTIQQKNQTLPTLFEKLRRAPESVKLQDYVHSNVSDIKGAKGLDIIASDFSLAWLENSSPSIGEAGWQKDVSQMIGTQAGGYDYIIVDCAPSITPLTEAWLAVCDFLLVPVRPDYLSSRGLTLLTRLRERAADGLWRFPQTLGTLITMKRMRKPSEDKWAKNLIANQSNKCFSTIIKYTQDGEDAAEFEQSGRTFQQKYGRDLAPAGRSLSEEIMNRLGRAKGGR